VCLTCLTVSFGLFVPVGTKWMAKVREVKDDAVCVARLRQCGVIMVGKAVMHELGMGTTGNNPIYGYVCVSDVCLNSSFPHPALPFQSIFLCLMLDAWKQNLRFLRSL
jgi:hypothetical protein